MVRFAALFFLGELSITKYFSDKESAKRIFDNIIDMVRNNRQYNNVPLWVLMKDMTNHGSGYSADFVREIGYNPDQIVKHHLNG